MTVLPYALLASQDQTAQMAVSMYFTSVVVEENEGQAYR